MFDNAVSFGVQSFSALILVVAAAMSATVMYGMGTRKAKETFLGLVLITMLCYQLYYMILASNYIPVYPTTYDSTLVRSDCQASFKGGKRGGSSQESYDINPCFCHSGANCLDSDSNIVSTNGTCVKDGTHTCYNPTANVWIDLYNSNRRNCHGGFGTLCTKDHPCDPCDYNTVTNFKSGRCSTCSTDYQGDCKFKPDEGPYCRVSNSSKAIEPCKKCCTEATLVYESGICY